MNTEDEIEIVRVVEMERKPLRRKPSSYRSKIDDPCFADPDFGTVFWIEVFAIMMIAWQVFRLLVLVVGGQLELLKWAII